MKKFKRILLFITSFFLLISCVPNSQNFYRGGKGFTCMCPNSKVGEKGKLDGELYESVDNTLLRKRIEEKKDLSKICTSLVTDMSYLFFENKDLNESIDNWDVSNVTTMKSMFKESIFNLPIGGWDVSNVEDMSQMFYNSLFNQQIGDWDVSNVTDMSFMFTESIFNQYIGNWDVGNVTDMRFMFSGSEFNRPIGNWNVKNVEDMDYMFMVSRFNQDISKWCVQKITSTPEGFSSYKSQLSSQNKPKWGTCPN